MLSGTFKGIYVFLYFEQLALSVTVLFSKVLVLINVAIMLIDFFSLFVPRYCFKFGVK
jgi:cytochrome c oxidase subunit IV